MVARNRRRIVRWYVVKNEQGRWVSDFAPLDSFDDACLVAKAYNRFNVVSEALYHRLKELKPSMSETLLEKPETD